MSEPVQPRAAYRVLIDGKDITARIRPVLVSINLSDKQRGEADEIEIRIKDDEGRIEMPRRGVIVRAAIGWEGGALVDKGAFRVDEVAHEGPPDIIVVRARSVDLTGKARNRRRRSWHATTLGAVLKDLAATQGLQLRVSPDLAQLAVPHLDQVNESDVHLLTRLGTKYDATATVKGGALVFLRIGKGQTAGGNALPTFAIRRTDVDTHTFTVADRERNSGVHAEWHDKGTGTRQTVQVGSNENSKGLRRVFHSEADAMQHARSEHDKQQRSEKRMTLTLARGDANLMAEMTGRVSGWRPEIDGVRWLIASLTHSVTADGGFQTSLELETLG